MPERLEWLLTTNFHDLTDHVQEEVYYAYYDFVYGTIHYIVKDHQITEDIIQESFLKVIHKMPTFDKETIMRAWMKVVARNSTINFLRKNKKFRNHVDIESVYMDIEPLVSNEPSVERTIEIKMMEESIMKYLHKLKPEYRLLMEYRWKQGMSYKEIAEQLNICEDVVRQRLYRTREGIKKMLFREWGNDHETIRSVESRLS
ncbi:RNA polymerase sigma-70 factor (ECF subfamily) [Paenibacillus anaericanus]|uniref:Sigma-70 family RNA polymerase sigma factor n=1 Tax=Paenibacillus anaericanus TaxID=170367 RepID=A0A3S1CB50_9BACL|nr:sigma-70 family RNA polymerase sigma factor [Paenibacillus anaericanus]MDQ0087661.1 RNA polymerase sigma-70 factor (ECF subfamily) [Paenibacillus anaericanus]RUT48027.1 sigma-70 family RNA polymerase sigma factor [Paenibacillus anaericanus]